MTQAILAFILFILVLDAWLIKRSVKVKDESNAIIEEFEKHYNEN